MAKTQEAAVEAEASKTSKKANAVCTKAHVDAEGVEHNSALGSVAAVRFKFKGGETRDVKLADLPDEMVTAATAHGLAQKLGDSYNTVKGDVALAIERFESVLEVIMGGEWISRAESAGPSSTMLSDALWAAFVAEKRPIVTTEGGREKVIAHVKGLDKDGRKALNEQPVVAAQLKRIRAERALAMAEKAEADAMGEKAPELPNL